MSIPSSLSIYVTFNFEGFHLYPGAPDDVSYLSSRHRHLFHVRVEIEVFHDERDIEYHQFLRKCRSFFSDAEECNGKSCETLARNLLEHIQGMYPTRHVSVEVNEDRECGSIVRAQPLVAEMTSAVTGAEEPERTEQGVLKKAVLFHGIEQEGPLRGNPTVFVGKAAQDQIESYFTEERLHELRDQGIAVYLGACHLSSWNLQLAHALHSAGVKFTIEQPRIPTHTEQASLHNANWVITHTLVVPEQGDIVLYKPDWYSALAVVQNNTRCYLKHDDGKQVVVIGRHDIYITRFEDANYANDTVIF